MKQRNRFCSRVIWASSSLASITTPGSFGQGLAGIWVFRIPHWGVGCWAWQGTPLESTRPQHQRDPLRVGTHPCIHVSGKGERTEDRLSNQTSTKITSTVLSFQKIMSRGGCEPARLNNNNKKKTDVRNAKPQNILLSPRCVLNNGAASRFG